MTKVTRLTFDEPDGSGRRIHLREISDDAGAPLETIGQDLRAARLRRGDDLASVSRVLKIRKDHLEALEEDRLDALPGRAYAIGFVRSYADYLGLDTAKCVERFKVEISGQAEEAPTIHLIDEDAERRLPQGWKIIAGVVVVLLLYGAWQLVANRMLSQPTPPPPQTSQTVTIASPRTLPAQQAQTSPSQGASAPSVAVVQGAAPATPPAAAVTKPGAASPTSSAPTTGAQSVGAPAQPGTSAPAAQTPIPQQQVAALPKGEVYGQQNKSPRVILRIHEPTRVLVLGPKHTVLINRTLKPGDTYQVPNVIGLTLTTPNGGAVEIDLDGAAMGYAGREQQMTESFSLDPQSIVDRYNGQAG